MKEVKWILTKKLEKTEELNRFEQTYSIKFPVQFKEIVLENNAGRPRPNVFDSSERTELVAKALLSFDSSHPDNIWDTYQHVKGRLPNDIVPFMSDQFGNYVCFDYQYSKKPAVVFWDHELSQFNPNKSVGEVADDFEEFLNCLYSL
ncbi:SMI1/KNR4 family protein [Priestia aryabhattai]|uniref:SMI1/KNR4 family protein n=1 Tax=Priestia aryabhattai TaxID=412384 RepID=A0ABD7WYN3_PRIAR|nr:SMI1/KNR4 family protein [Priestia aryabhattai]WEA45441.1 SMI1/KNR4 family protein [Priestia aryabhattai]